MTQSPSRFVFLAGCFVLAPVSAYFAHSHYGIRIRLEHGLMSLFIVTFAAPVLEEWLFRKEIQCRIAHHTGNEHLANLLASSLFVVLHWQAGFPFLLLWYLPGLALGEVWRKHKSLHLNIAVHAWFNFALLFVQ